MKVKQFVSGQWDYGFEQVWVGQYRNQIIRYKLALLFDLFTCSCITLITINITTVKIAIKESFKYSWQFYKTQILVGKAGLVTSIIWASLWCSGHQVGLSTDAGWTYFTQTGTVYLTVTSSEGVLLNTEEREHRKCSSAGPHSTGPLSSQMVA